MYLYMRYMYVQQLRHLSLSLALLNGRARLVLHAHTYTHTVYFTRALFPSLSLLSHFVVQPAQLHLVRDLLRIFAVHTTGPRPLSQTHSSRFFPTLSQLSIRAFFLYLRCFEADARDMRWWAGYISRRRRTHDRALERYYLLATNSHGVCAAVS